MTLECFLVSGSFLTSGWWQSQGGPFHFMILLWACFEHVGSLESIPTPGMSITCFSLSTDSRQGTSKSLSGYGCLQKWDPICFLFQTLVWISSKMDHQAFLRTSMLKADEQRSRLELQACFRGAPGVGDTYQLHRIYGSDCRDTQV